jgi:transmembrane sensor
MNKEKAKAWLVKYEQGALNEEQRRRMHLFYLKQATQSDDQLSDEQLLQSYAFLKRALPLSEPISKTIKLWQQLSIAVAVAIVVLGAGFFYFKTTIKEQDSGKVAIQQDVAPGKHGATLKLGNGKTIKLSNAMTGELAKEAGVSITKSANGQLEYTMKEIDAHPNLIHTLTTANGESYNVRLPDGSLVYLNAASSLTYTASLIEHGKRVVKLMGEGYFEVAKDKAHPFVVKTRSQEVEVLGTHFNVNAYQGEHKIKTTLLEGAVSVKTGSVNKHLAPGEQSIVYGGAIAIANVDVEEVVAWKQGYFDFVRTDIQTVMDQISRWYDVEVAYEGPITTEKFTGRISRNRNLSQVLKIVQSSKSVQIIVKGRRIIVK